MIPEIQIVIRFKGGWETHVLKEAKYFGFKHDGKDPIDGRAFGERVIYGTGFESILPGLRTIKPLITASKIEPGVPHEL